jgi:hypothetical protein
VDGKKEKRMLPCGGDGDWVRIRLGVKKKKKKKKGKEKGKKIRVLLTFRPFRLPGEVVLLNGQKNGFNSPNESAPQMKLQPKLF